MSLMIVCFAEIGVLMPNRLRHESGESYERRRMPFEGLWPEPGLPIQDDGDGRWRGVLNNGVH